MATPAQIAANQANAQKSTGPRTEAGKVKTRTNATRHGLCAFLYCMDDEDTKESDALLADLMEEHQPQGPTEQILVFKMAEAFWLSKRATEYLRTCTCYNQQASRKEEEGTRRQVSLYLRYYTTGERAFNRNLNDLRKLQKERREHAAQEEELPAQEQLPQEIGFVPQSGPVETENPAPIALQTPSIPPIHRPGPQKQAA